MEIPSSKSTLVSIRDRVFPSMAVELWVYSISNACSNVNFDMGRFGIDFVASPRHADVIVITGPITENMAYALEDCYKSVPSPKLVILCGACAISGGIFQNSKTINREFLEKYPIDLYIPGCPVHPLTFINGILSYIQN